MCCPIKTCKRKDVSGYKSCEEIEYDTKIDNQAKKIKNQEVTKGYTGT